MQLNKNNFFDEKINLNIISKRGQSFKWTGEILSQNILGVI